MTAILGFTPQSLVPTRPCNLPTVVGIAAPLGLPMAARSPSGAIPTTRTPSSSSPLLGVLNVVFTGVRRRWPVDLPGSRMAVFWPFVRAARPILPGRTSLSSLSRIPAFDRLLFPRSPTSITMRLSRMTALNSHLFARPWPV